MASHRKHTVTLSSLSLRQWAKFGAIVAGFVALVTLGFASRGFILQLKVTQLLLLPILQLIARKFLVAHLETH